MLSIYFNSENSTDFVKKQQNRQQKFKQEIHIFDFKKHENKFENFIPKFYTVDFDSIKGGKYVIDYTKEEVKNNKEIGNSKQVKNNCWLLSGIYALANNPIGKEYIKKSITHHNNDTIIHFKGTNTTITIPHIVLNAAKQSKYYLKGDDNMLAIEIATEYYKKMLIINNESTVNTPNVVNGKHSFGDLNDPLAGGFSSDIMYLITGEKAKTFFNPKKGCSTEIKNIIRKIQENPDIFAATCNFKQKKYGLHIRHAYTIKNIGEKFVTLINPHNSAKEENIPIKDFYENVNSITLLDLKN